MCLYYLYRVYSTSGVDLSIHSSKAICDKFLYQALDFFIKLPSFEEVDLFQSKRLVLGNSCPDSFGNQCMKACCQPQTCHSPQLSSELRH